MFVKEEPQKYAAAKATAIVFLIGLSGHAGQACD
jgi:hypothetical protein